MMLAVATPAAIVGTWEGTMKALGGPQTLRRIMVITNHDGTYTVTIHSLEESYVPIVTKNVKVEGSNVTMTFDMNTEPWLDYHRIYHAKLGANDATMEGIWRTTEGPSFKVETSFHRVAHASWPVIEPKVTMVEVQPGVKIEAFDWGGSGRPVLWLAGLGNTGGDFYTIVPDLKAHYHLYSMTRRGFGNSSKPAGTVANYSADRLGDDVLAVMDAFHIEKPVLIGHSIAGEELSDIGTRYPDKVAGLIYLDAGYEYAFNVGVSMPIYNRPPPGAPAIPPIPKAILDGKRDFKGSIGVPTLAIYANPHTDPALISSKDKAALKQDNVMTTEQIAGVRRAEPNAKITVIPNANHFVFLSNTDEVLRDINAFIKTLPD